MLQGLLAEIVSLNVAKCEYMFIGNDKQLSKISDIGNLGMGNDEIKRVRKTKYLGLTIDESLSWSQQYNIVKGKLKGGLNSIKKLRNILLQSQLFLVYQALIESHLRYGNLIWSHLPEKNSAHCRRYKTGHFALLNQPQLRIKCHPSD